MKSYDHIFKFLFIHKYRALREMNLLKQDVRASFNMNSSYENSCNTDSNFHLNGTESKDHGINSSAFSNVLQIPKTRLNNIMAGGSNKVKSISTPVRNAEISNPFKCTLSPIGNWEFRYFNNAMRETKCLDYNKFSATTIHNDVDVDMMESSLTAEQEHSEKDRKEDSSLSSIIQHLGFKRKLKYVCSDSNEIPHEGGSSPTLKTNIVFSLQPGKWRKSLNLWRRTQPIPSDNICSRENVDTKGSGCTNKRQISLNTNVAGQRKSTLIHKHSILKPDKNNFKRQLLRRCMQNNIITFEDAYNIYYLQHCYKIGEGAYGEVFLYTKPDGKDAEKTVLKIIPIEGKELINGEVQKSFEQILQEVIISMELSALKDKHRESSYAAGFVNVERVRCVEGRYPVLLQKLWQEYDDRKVSENDHPECFTSSQQYIVLEMTFSGEDLEKFVFRNAEQSFYALHQIIYALAVGEDVYQFEHRDLHLGNVLVVETNHKKIVYKLKDKILSLPTKGVQITIIDYTLSRITYDDCCFYNDLSSDPELFTATGDYQFEIYRMMRTILNDKWESYEPKTNIFWMSYIISKMLDGVTYKNNRSKIHFQYMEKLRDLHSSILTYTSCADYVRSL